MFVIWFLFDESDQEHIFQIIKELSNQYDCPAFIPHITALGLINTEFEEIDKIILNSIKGIKSFFIEKNKLSFSDEFWKTLFIDISPNKNLTEINQKLKKNLLSVQKYDFLPHISLMYKNISKNEKQKLVTSLITKNSFKISRLGILEFSQNIEEWKIIKKYSLNKF